MLHPGWRQVPAGTLWPHWNSPLSTRKEFVAANWQASAETEQLSAVRRRDQTEPGITMGMIISNPIGYFITVTTARHAAVQPLRVEADARDPLAARLAPGSGGAGRGDSRGGGWP